MATHLKVNSAMMLPMKLTSSENSSSEYYNHLSDEDHLPAVQSLSDETNFDCPDNPAAQS